jgi:hypothetical protein
MLVLVLTSYGFHSQAPKRHMGCAATTDVHLVVAVTIYVPGCCWAEEAVA